MQQLRGRTIATWPRWATPSTAPGTAARCVRRRSYFNARRPNPFLSSSIWASSHTVGARQLPAMVADWRAVWSATPGTTDPLAPFGVATLAAGGSEGNAGHMAAMRSAQQVRERKFIFLRHYLTRVQLCTFSDGLGAAGKLRPLEQPGTAQQLRRTALRPG